MNISILLTQSATAHPQKKFLIAGEESLTFAEVEAQANRFAGVLTGLGIKPGQVVALLLPNSPAFVACYFGVLKTGAIVAPLNITSPGPELAHFLNDSQATLLVTQETLLPVAFDGVQGAGGACSMVLVVGKPGEASLPAMAQWLELMPVKPVDVSIFNVTESTPALLIYTSGTTGRPKAAIITHGNILAFTPIFGRDILELSENSVVLMVAPGSHAIGQVLLNTATFARCTLSLLPRFEPALFLQTVERDQVSSFISVPSLVQMLLNSPQATPQALSSLQTIMIGGAALSFELATRFIEQFNVRLKVSYAATEAYAIAFGEIPAIPDGSVGKPASLVNLRILDETNADVAPGQSGEILVRSPQVFAGYHNLPGQDTVYWLDGWFRTGDIGYLDENGYLFLVARRKEIIKSSGYTIYPAEVETVLQNHPAVAMAAVAGMPHASMGEVIVAFVVSKPGTAPTARELIHFCKERLAPYKCPRRVEFRDRLPHNSAGKILRNQLVEELK